MVSALKRRVLFLCTGNSARSQMAEVLLRHQAGEHFEVFSAGTQPEGIDPGTIAALSNFGISGNELDSKHINLFEGQNFDYVITLCDKARQECKAYPNADKQMAWDFEDPKLRSIPMPFETTLNEINNRISMFVLVETKEVAQEALHPIQFYKCLTDEIRLKCLMLIQYEGELCVCELMAALKDVQPKVSRNLAMLRKSELLIDRRLGQWVFYRINPALPAWAKSVIAATTESNVGLIQDNIRNLCLMGKRPDRAKTYC
jgi:ArsR family transcriptional regulator, arsenate/arsenite/antimonite-responsive transcriptional repressor / arsenate reductase (thioredoxin)